MMIALMGTQDLKGQNGKALFEKSCVACHTIGGGRTVGPDLLGVNQKRDKTWLISFIKSSQGFIKSGDADAMALFNEFMKIPMPDQNLTDAEINQILQYINEKGGAGEGTGEAKPEPAPVLIGNVNSGLDLFTGKKSFTNGGATCISCHTVNDKAVYYGGSLAKDLSQSYKLLQKAGIESVLQYLSFPAMSDTYSKNELTAEEIADLTAYLQKVSEKSDQQTQAGLGSYFLLYGILAFFILIAIIEAFWRNNKPKSVKDHIYNPYGL
ncbi:MAG: cytochrome c [Bacteroidales bacterium]|nr:cytochrome c [Bacteroidales bacterium]MCF8455916.1 cytochrome c [Bacteroidales bacterium]